MEDKLKEWTEAIIPWLLSHGLKIVIIAVVEIGRASCRERV